VSFRSDARPSALFITALLPRDSGPASNAALEVSETGNVLEVRVDRRQPGRADHLRFAAPERCLDPFNEIELTRTVGR
jgi:hypothetical protein